MVYGSIISEFLFNLNVFIQLLSLSIIDFIDFDKIENNPLIEQLIEQAKKDVIAKRCYPDSYTQEMIEEDMNSYDGVIVNLVVYDYSQAGENYMSSFSENGVSRNWRKRSELFVGVYPFAKVL